MHYYPAFICENGHVLEVASFECDSLYCSECSAPIISMCPNCRSTIRGHEVGCSGHYRIPSYCDKCGNPYPWTFRAQAIAEAIIKEDTNISTDERDLLLDVVPDMIVETPKTRLAAVRIKKAFKVLGTFAADGLRQFLIDYGCDLLRQLI